MAETWTRRRFVASLAGAGALVWARRAAAAAGDATKSFRVGLVLPGGGALGPVSAALADGARLAAEEAARTAELLGGHFELATAMAAGPEAAGAEARRLIDQGKVIALVGGLDAPARAAVGGVAAERGVPLLTVRSPADGAAAEARAATTFHAASSPQARLDALARHLAGKSGLRRWHLATPATDDGRRLAELARAALPARGAEVVGETPLDGAGDPAPLLARLAGAPPDVLLLGLGGPAAARLLERLGRPAFQVACPFLPLGVEGALSLGAAGGLFAVDWHPALGRFGAEQLNQRFEARFGRPMDAAAWTGWMAVKAVAELALRPGEGDSAGRLARLRFDGHKGMALAFDPVDGHLVQPVYLVGPLVGSGDGGSLALVAEVTPE